MSSLPSLTYTTTVLLIVVSILFGSTFAIASAQQAPLTQQEQEEANRMYSVQKLTTQYLEEGDKMIDGVIFTPRWGNVVFVEPGSLSVIFANCLPGEFAVSSQKILGGSDLNVLESYGMATPKPNDFMMWLMVVENLNETNKLPASAGVICVSDRDIDVENPASTIILSPEFNQQVSNIVNNFIKIENKQIINLQQITNVYQQITQTAIQIAIGGGNVTQIINQSASQIAASNGTNVSQIINQTASQTAAAPAPNATNVNQTIGQAANQTAAAPAPNATNVNQTIGQAANQTAAVGVTPDTTPPVISVPEDITEEATGPGGAQVSFQVSAQDDVDGPVDVSCNRNSGDTFPIGDTEVECSATDAAGNTGTESFTVTVNSPAGNEGTTSPPSSNDTDA
jgi:HYR domain